MTVEVLVAFTPLPDGPARALSLCCSISIEGEGTGPLRTNLARECVTALAQVCEDLDSDFFEEGPLKMNGVLGLLLSFFSLNGDNITVFYIHRFDHVNDISIVQISLAGLIVWFFLRTFPLIISWEWLFESLVIRIFVVPIHNYITIID